MAFVLKTTFYFDCPLEARWSSTVSYPGVVLMIPIMLFFVVDSTEWNMALLDTG
ncbi:hypothetical protein DPEC_G00063130 [Dallia pectoralis]|uniref:Uncharacterized protein n=1 Tax=Dallia pectoralis TaxID=75939 RepID=A0ACC2H7S4_DALPE|nr:hypothetical protein DPEC_G00063130 [Dallia pectoralis]